MILKGSQRGGAMALGKHLLNVHDNEHIELHQIRGFISDNLMGAMREAYAVSKGTQCRQHLFSVSLSPPETENVPVQVFEDAIEQIEERNGLLGQPRLIVFHEKEGRRHAHVVWSRIDAQHMKAVNLSFFKTKLRDISKELYLEHGWKMPRGLMDSKARDPLNYDLATYQQAKRMGRSARDLKREMQECWAVSDSRTSFEAALKERGLYLAKGDRRGFVAISVEKPDEVLSVARYVGRKAKDVRARLGAPDNLPSVEETQSQIAKARTPQLQRLMDEARQKAARAMQLLAHQRQALKQHHTHERQKLDTAQKQRWAQETKVRSERLDSGLRGLWQSMTGKRKAIYKQNQMEAFQALERDREQRQALIYAQLQDRQRLQMKIRRVRQTYAKDMAALHKDSTANKKMRVQFKIVQKGSAHPIFERSAKAPASIVETKAIATSVEKVLPQTTAKRPREDKRPTPVDRLQRLRSGKPSTGPSRSKGPDFDH